MAWTERELVIERIQVDKKNFEGIQENIKNFFIYGILPEIIVKWYTRKPVTNMSVVVPESRPEVCTETQHEDYMRSHGAISPV